MSGTDAESQSMSDAKVGNVLRPEWLEVNVETDLPASALPNVIVMMMDMITTSERTDTSSPSFLPTPAAASQSAFRDTKPESEILIRIRTFADYE